MEVESHGEITETTTPAAEPSDGFDMAGAVDSIGADLGFGETAEEPATEVVETSAAEPSEEPAPAADPEAPPAPATPAPRTWRPEASAEWAKLPPVVQAEIIKREEDMFRGIESYKADATFGKTMQTVIKPFEHIMQQYNINPAQQINNLLLSHYKLAFGTPEEKSAILDRIITDYGLQAPGEAPYVDPQVQALQTELQNLKSSLQGVQQQRENEVRTTLAKELDTFMKDPAHAEFETVASDIASLLQTGQAQSLQEAYDKAVWLNPVTRAKQIERETLAKAAEARKGAEKKAAEVRRATAANVRAKPKSASAATPLGSMDESLEATLAAIKARG